jgi:hypothetical protein
VTDTKRDNIKIGLSAGILITMLVTSVGFAFHAGRVRQMVDANTASVVATAAMVSGHFQLEGHPVLAERVGSLIGQVGEVKEGVDKNAGALHRIEAKLNTEN